LIQKVAVTFQLRPGGAIIIDALPWSGLQAALRAARAENVAGK